MFIRTDNFAIYAKMKWSFIVYAGTAILEVLLIAAQLGITANELLKPDTDYFRKI